MQESFDLTTLIFLALSRLRDLAAAVRFLGTKTGNGGETAAGPVPAGNPGLARRPAPGGAD